ncbi:hypothetical protein DL769_000564 [Monosporascus sp. CRB-8-3]|nr:hypothetical protein DL769_000564 [Monosporascus sp. CRB-8-3]
MELSLVILVVDALATPQESKLSPVTRNGSRLPLDGREWKARGLNIYWLGLDENVTPPACRFQRQHGERQQQPPDPAVLYERHDSVGVQNYIQTLLTRRNAYNGLAYAEDPAIFTYETGNELEGPASRDMDVPTDWIQDIARLVKELAPEKLFIDGTYGINATHLDIDEVDIYSDHFYPVDTGKLWSDIKLVASSSQVFFAGDYDWRGQGGDPLETFYRVIEENPAAAGGAFWSLSGRNLSDCSVRALCPP